MEALNKCTVEGCERWSKSKIGLCNLHYKKWKRYGDPLSTHQIRKTMLSKICKADGCDRLPVSKIGYCSMHYYRWKQWGDPSTVKIIKDDRTRLWSHINKNSGLFAIINGITSECWLWTGLLSDQGYGLHSVSGVRRKAHRWIYERINGPIPKGLEPDHLCHHRSCVRPDHMEPVTHAENCRRAIRPVVMFCPKGHLYSDENTFHRSDGRRECRTCMGLRSKNNYIKMRNNNGLSCNLS
jgi:hypothetical protein